MPVPLLFDIFSPPCVTKPWPKTLRGTSRPAAISSAGQMTAWNRVMSLPITWRSHGHTRSKKASSAPKPGAVT